VKATRPVRRAIEEQVRPRTLRENGTYCVLYGTPHPPA